MGKQNQKKLRRRGWWTLRRWTGLVLFGAGVGWVLWQRYFGKKTHPAPAEEAEPQELEIPVVPGPFVPEPPRGSDALSFSAPAAADDLTRIEGIGPKVAGILNAAGVSTYAQLAETDVAQLAAWLQAAGLRFMDPATWPQQAAFAAAGDREGLKAFRDSLKGGRRA